MNRADTKIINIPNFISLVRILMAPVLFYFAFTKQSNWYFGVLLFAVFTDVLDGFLARTLHQITEMGSHLDSWGDFVIYTTMAICAWMLWPDIVERELLYYIVMALSFTVPVLIGYMKFHTFTSYHTWSVKLAVFVSIIAYFLLFSEISDLPFKIAALLCLYAAIEQTIITLLIHHEHVDVRTVWQALKYHRENR